LLSDTKNGNKDKFFEFLDSLTGTNPDLTKKIKRWMIRNGIDVDI